MSSPTARTLQLLRDEGWSAGVVERMVHIPGRPPFKLDLFGCIDVVACHKYAGETMGVQCTSAPNHASRRVKALALPELKTWLLAGNRFEVWSWRKVGRFWRVRQEAIRLEHCDPHPQPKRARARPPRQRVLPGC